MQTWAQLGRELGKRMVGEASSWGRGNLVKENLAKENLGSELGKRELGTKNGENRTLNRTVGCE